MLESTEGWALCANAEDIPDASHDGSDRQSAGTFTNCFLDRKPLEAQSKTGQIGSYDMLTTWSLSVKQKASGILFSLCRGPNHYYQWFTSPLRPNQLKYCGIPELWSLSHLADKVVIKNQWMTKFNFQILHCWRLDPLSPFCLCLSLSDLERSSCSEQQVDLKLHI